MKTAPTAANIAKIGNRAEWKVVWYLFRATSFFFFKKSSSRFKQIDAALRDKISEDYTPESPLNAFLVSHIFVYSAARFYVLI